MQLSRRSLITGLGALLVASPAIVRAGSLMPVKSWNPTAWAYGGWVMQPGDCMTFIWTGKEYAGLNGMFPTQPRMVDNRVIETVGALLDLGWSETPGSSLTVHHRGKKPISIQQAGRPSWAA
jgi:hypothetical protein